MKKESVTGRIHYVDSGRALASILGIFYHSALAFSYPWIISVDPSEYAHSLWAASRFLHYFRMPLFLFVAGYFTMYSLRKYSPVKYLLHRSRRILLPLISSLVLLLPVMKYFRLKYQYGSEWTDYFLRYINPLSSEFSLEHLWFLYHVFVFAVIVLVFSQLHVREQMPGVARRFIRWIHNSLFWTIVFWILVQEAFANAGDLLSQRVSFLSGLDLRGQGRTFPMFLFGCYCFHHRDQMEALFRYDRRRIVATIVAFLPLFMVRIRAGYDPHGELWDIVDTSLRWILTLGVLGLLRYGLDRASKRLTYLSDASYPVYLFHQPVIIIVSYFFMSSSWAFTSWPGYALVTACSIVLTYLAYELLVHRNRLGAFLFTGSSLRRSPRSRR